MTQHTLGELAGLTFQQVQKYEKGVNRVSAGRLFEFATLLGVPIAYFYDGCDKLVVDLLTIAQNEITDIEPTKYPLITAETEALLTAFEAIEDKRIRKLYVQLVGSIAAALNPA